MNLIKIISNPNYVFNVVYNKKLYTALKKVILPIP